MFVIAGVTGHVGGVAASTLLARGSKIKVIVRDPAKGRAWSNRGAEVAVGSLEDTAFLTGALRNADGFFTLLPPNFQAADFYGQQRKVADSIAAAVLASRVPLVVMLSSVGAELDTGTGPIRGLHYLENELLGTGTKLVAIRAGYFQENVLAALEPARSQGIVPNFTPSADQPMPMIATRDIGQLVADTLLSPPGRSEVVDLHGPAYSMRQVAEKLGAALGKTLRLVDVPQTEWVAALTKSGMPSTTAEVFAEMYGAFSTGRIAPHGDRMIQGRTTLDEVLKSLVR